jgi:hypothetical protein
MCLKNYIGHLIEIWKKSKIQVLEFGTDTNPDPAKLCGSDPFRIQIRIHNTDNNLPANLLIPIRRMCKAPGAAF